MGGTWRAAGGCQWGHHAPGGGAAAGWFSIAGSSVRELRFRQRYNATLVAVRRGQEVIRDLLGRVVLQAGDVLLIQAPIDTIRGLQNRNDLLLLDELEKDLPTTSRKGAHHFSCW